MERRHYRLFQEGTIGGLTIKNRLVRSATVDVALTGEVSDRVIEIYRDLARGGVGLIITGEYPVGLQPEIRSGVAHHIPLWFEGIERVADVVHEQGDGCKVVAQIGAEVMGIIGSDYPGRSVNKRVVDTSELPIMLEHFTAQISRLKAAGFDGVQIHGAHGYFFNSLLSPYANNREDEFGGSLENRVRIIREIVDAARGLVGNYPILIKAGCDDFVEGGYDADSFPELAEALVTCGIDAIELSCGMNPNKSDYKHQRKGVPFEPHACNLDIPIPTILVDSIRDAEEAEALVSTGVVDFVSMCKPFINEPGLPNRWRDGTGKPRAGCIECNCCVPLSNYKQYGVLNECIFKDYPKIYREMKGAT